MACAKPVQVCRDLWTVCASSVDGSGTIVDLTEIPKRQGKWQRQVAKMLEKPEQALRIRIPDRQTYESVRSGIYKAAKFHGVIVRIERFDDLVFVRFIHRVRAEL
jgi:hypothetical protein